MDPTASNSGGPQPDLHDEFSRESEEHAAFHGARTIDPCSAGDEPSFSSHMSTSTEAAGRKTVSFNKRQAIKLSTIHYQPTPGPYYRHCYSSNYKPTNAASRTNSHYVG